MNGACTSPGTLAVWYLGMSRGHCCSVVHSPNSASTCIWKVGVDADASLALSPRLGHPRMTPTGIHHSGGNVPSWEDLQTWTQRPDVRP